MVRLKLSLELNYEIQGQGSDFIFNIHNAHTRHQRVSDEHLELSQSIATDIYTDPAQQIVIFVYTLGRALKGTLSINH